MAGTRRSARLIAKVDAPVAATQFTQKELPLQNKQLKDTGVIEKTTMAQGSRKKKKTSHEQDASNVKAVSDQSNRSRAKAKGMNSKFMKDIPFDILLEIFSLLEPLDLLNLSRMSKSLHSLLTSNDVSFLWKLVYKNITPLDRPPPCPDNTNVVFYTDYLYGRHCQFCSSIHGQIYHESAFIRLCSKCASKSFLCRRGHEVESTVSRLCSAWTPPKYACAGPMILKVEYSLRLREFKQARKEKKDETYIAGRVLDVDRRFSTAGNLRLWRERMKQLQLKKRKDLRYRREADIKKKLLEEDGCSAADADKVSYYAYRMPHVRKSVPLTDSEWSSIRADILDFLQDLRDDQAIKDIKYALQNGMKELEWFISQRWRIHPCSWWFVSSEPIASLLKLGGRNQIPDKELVPQLRDVIASWKEETDRYLTTLIPQPSGKGSKKHSRNSKTNVLELAATFFKCHWCTEPISYPRILMHGCLLKDIQKQEEVGAEEDEEGDIDDDLEEQVVADDCGPRAPRPPKEITYDTVLSTLLVDYYSPGMCAGKEGVTYDEEASNVVRDIITAFGQDPKTVTYAAMEGMDARIECLRCRRAMRAKKRAKSVRLVMKWNMAVVHELEEHYGELPSPEPAWAKIDSLEDLAKVEDAEGKVRMLDRNKNLVSCNHCSWRGVPLRMQLFHLTSVHKIVADEVTIAHHIAPLVDSPIKAFFPAVKI